MQVGLFFRERHGATDAAQGVRRRDELGYVAVEYWNQTNHVVGIATTANTGTTDHSAGFLAAFADIEPIRCLQQLSVYFIARCPDR